MSKHGRDTFAWPGTYVPSSSSHSSSIISSISNDTDCVLYALSVLESTGRTNAAATPPPITLPRPRLLGRLPRKQRAPRSALFRLKIEKTVYNCIYTIFLTQTQLQLLQTVGYPVPEKIGTKVTRQKMSMRVAEERFGVPRSTLCNWKKASMNGIFKLFCL